MEGPMIFATVLIVITIIMKIADSIIDIIIRNKMNIIELSKEFDIIKNEINILNEQLKPYMKTSDYNMILHKANDDWSQLSEEVTDIYNAIKHINTEIMLIKNKIF